MRKNAVVDTGACAACGTCVKACPKDSITVFRGCYALIDTEKCVGCGLCAKTCPAGCIKVAERSQVK